MLTIAIDSQIVSEVESTLFSLIQSGPTDAQIFLKNSGVNTMNYRLAYYSGTAWVDLGTAGSDYYNTLSPNEVKLVSVSSAYPKIQMVGNASGGAYLEFSVSRYYNRASGSAVPLLSL